MMATALSWQYTLLDGKKPIVQNWPKNPATQEQIDAHLERGGNVGVITGTASGIVVVDVDAAKGGQIPKGLPDTVAVATGGGGYHFYFRYPEGVVIKNSAGKLGEHVDVRGDGGQVVAEGSIHPETGNRYAWMPGRSPDDIEIAEMPPWLIEACSAPKAPAGTVQLPLELKRGAQYLATALEREVARVRASRGGNRNHTLNQAAFNLGQLECEGMDEFDVREELIKAAAACGLVEDDGLQQAQKTIRSGWVAGTGQPRTRRPKPQAVIPDLPKEIDVTTQRGAALIFRELTRDRALHHSGLGWLSWDGKRWTSDGKGVQEMTFEVPPVLRKQAWNTEDEKHQKALLQAAKRADTADFAAGVMKIASALDGLNAEQATFDQDPLLLNVRNGTLDLGTGALYPHSQQDRITKVTLTRYSPATKAPLWEKFLHEVFQGDQAIIEWVQWFLGYSLTGSTRAQVFAIFYGGGANGKSTLVDAVRYVIDQDYSHAMSPQAMMVTNNQGSDQIAALRGVRLVTAQESQQGARINEGLIKSLVGGDPMRARYLYQNEFEFIPQCKLILSTNFKPRIDDQSRAMWRRLRLVPFNARFEGEARDNALKEKLFAEAEGILTWMVEGVLKHGDVEPKVPHRMAEAAQQYRSDEDKLHDFLFECCEHKEGAFVTKRDLYLAYSAYTQGKCDGERKFTEQMRHKGYQEYRDSQARWWRDIKLKPDYE